MEKRFSKILAIGVLSAMAAASHIEAQSVKLAGEVWVRWYDEYDERSSNQRLDYGRIRGRLKVQGNITDNVTSFVGVQSGNLADDDAASAYFSRTQVMELYNAFINLAYRNVWIFKKIEFRPGRQYYGLGEHLVVGTYLPYDGARFDLNFWSLQLEGFAARTDQSLTTQSSSTPTTLNPAIDNGNLYSASLKYILAKSSISAYYVRDSPQGYYNDQEFFGGHVELRTSNAFLKKIGLGGGTTSKILKGFRVAAEGAYQRNKSNPSLAESQQFGNGWGVLGIVSYTWEKLSIFDTLIFSGSMSRASGDDSNTAKVEYFSPRYSYFFMGNRTFFSNNTTAGSYPMANRVYYAPSIAWRFKFHNPLRFETSYVIADKSISNSLGLNDVTLRNEFDFNIKYDFAEKVFMQVQYSFRHTPRNNGEQARDSTDFRQDHRIRSEFRVAF